MTNTVLSKESMKEMSELLYSFSQNTSIHGIRFLGEKHLYISRRLIWFLLVCASMGLLIYQITDRLIYYYSRPVTVNFKVNYNSSVQFPAVTVCNQNAFKGTLAAKHNLYQVLEKMYANGDTMEATELNSYNASEVQLDQLYLQTAHDKEDLIIKCMFKGIPCDPRNFTQVITDHGVCYTFTTNQENGFISSPGLENGLRLTLNVEQYEYMPGPHDAAGIKMLVHTPGEFPLVHNLGQAIPTGNHVFAGIKLSKINNLPYPYGNCRTKLLDNVDIYSSEACRLDCQNRITEQMCKCRNPFMLSKRGLQRVCTLKQHIGCVRKRKVNGDVWKCDCPVPCSFESYENEISYASTSYFSMYKLLGSKNISALRESLLKAKEVSSRMDRRMFDTTTSLFNELTKEYSIIYTTVLNLLKKSATELEKQMVEGFGYKSDIYKFKERLFRNQMYNVEQSFVRARKAMDERTFNNVAVAYAEFGLTIKSKVKELINETDPDMRAFLYMLAIDMLENRIEIVRMCMKNYTDIYNAYKFAIGIFDYSFENIPRSHNNYSIPEYLIKSSLNHNEYSLQYGPLLRQRINESINSLKRLKLEVIKAYNGNDSLDGTEQAVELFYEAMRKFNFAKSVFDKFIIEWPIGILNNRLEFFKTVWKDLHSNYVNLIQNVRTTVNDINVINKTFNFLGQYAIETFENYLLDKKITKYSVAETISSNVISQRVFDIQSFFDQVKIREHGMKDILARIREDEIDFWTTLIQDNDSVRYYEFVNKTELTMNLSDILDEIEMNFTDKQAMMTFSNIIRDTDISFFDTFGKVTEDFISFKKAITIDNELIRQNILKLDIFYQQMSYDEIDQQKAYDIFALICDIGGSMGLFIGASILSLFELLDLLTSNIFFRTKRKRTSN